MDFKSNKPIYMQIADFCFKKILLEEWEEDERIPSVRELGMLLQVNPNTVMRTFDYLQEEDVIYLKRGTGYYVKIGARNKILTLQKKEFFDETLIEVFKTMKMLNVDMNEVAEKYKKFK